MSPSRIKNSPLTMRSHPGPWLLVPITENGAILLVVLVMHVGFIPALKPLKPLHHRVVSLCDPWTEHSGPVTLELPAKQIDHPRIHPEAG